MDELHLFAGVGGGILGGQLLGHRTVCAVEIEPYCREVLLQRQRDGVLSWFPVWDDVRTFDGKPWRGKVDVICGGFPCQDISVAGKGDGIQGKRSGLWKEMARIVGEIEPRYVFVENSPALTGRGLDRVLLDLAQMGYDANWCCLSASEVGAPHRRERVWILAYSRSSGIWCKSRGARKNRKHIFRQRSGTKSSGRTKSTSYMGNSHNDGQSSSKDTQGINERSNRNKARKKEAAEPKRPSLFRSSLANTNGEGKLQPAGINKEEWRWACNSSNKNGEVSHLECFRLQRARQKQKTKRQAGLCRGERRDEEQEVQPFSWWKTEPRLGRVVDGVADRVHRIKAIGNGQVPLVASTAWQILEMRMLESERREIEFNQKCFW